MINYSPAITAARLQLVLDAINAGSGAGYVEIYGNTRPATGAAAGATPLAKIVLNKPAGTISGHVLTFSVSPLPEDNSADATGTPTWARVSDSTGAFVFDASAGVGTGDFNFLTSLTATQPVRLQNGSITTGN